MRWLTTAELEAWLHPLPSGTRPQPSAESYTSRHADIIPCKHNDSLTTASRDNLFMRPCSAYCVRVNPIHLIPAQLRQLINSPPVRTSTWVAVPCSFSTDSTPPSSPTHTPPRGSLYPALLTRTTHLHHPRTSQPLQPSIASPTLFAVTTGRSRPFP